MSRPGAKRYSVRSSQPSSKKKRTSYSHITAADVVQSIGKEELIKKLKRMLTDHRTVLLEDRDLIDSDCRDSIQAKLKSGQRAGAATELLEYFEDNHDGDKMMEFCTFLEDQAGNTSPRLVQLANTIRECVKALSEPGKGKEERAAPQDSLHTEVKRIITDTADFLPYMDKMTPHLTLLGTVLGIGDLATAIRNGPGSPQDKCLDILKKWFDETPNPTWNLFCKKLGRSPTFNNLRDRIEEDHDASGLANVYL